ncbi:MAG: DUF72 domain-containing protein [Calditrichaeota bacterium]|nr:DUF72 domain-containing protein [Calditrichota bacterium]RQV92985.1 MAG: DUF72 domain-containing protein [bacterium]RQW08067.1 MAG: DUF72 domain-containing protein [Calditrichota bacterium]
MSKLRIGTCSWKYNSWHGLVYSEPKPQNHLAEYSQKYNTVEIDQWFWSLFGVEKVALPSPSTVREYVDSVLENFRFTVKIPNSITLTHYYRKKKTDPLVENPHFLSLPLFSDFLHLISPMKEKLGPLMFQFEYLNKHKMPNQDTFMEKFEKFLEQTDPDFQYAVEIRNPNYLNRSYFEFLRNLGISHVFLQGYYMPSVVSIYKKFENLLSDSVVIRLHGPDRSNIEDLSGGSWDRILEPKDIELKQIADIVRDLLDRKMEVYLNVNNHYEGSAPLSIRRLEKFLAGGSS